MGRSATIHCIGLGKPNRDGERAIYHAMSKLEVAQQMEKAKRRGDTVVKWYAQTKTGCRILGTTFPYEEIPAKFVKLPKTIKCPICNGIGSDGKAYCPVCNGSGITRQNHWKKWQNWQLENIKKQFIDKNR